MTEACTAIVQAIRRVRARHQRPILAALDGGSGAGKSTLAAQVAPSVDATIIPLDDFFSAQIPDAQWDAFSVEERLEKVFDWPRLRSAALLPLLARRPAVWHAFDFAAGQRPDGSYAMQREAITRPPPAVILLDGAYAAGPALADLVDLAILVDVSVAERHQRLARREDPAFLRQWHARWDPVEEHYFSQVRPRSAFDLVVTPATTSG